MEEIYDLKEFMGSLNVWYVPLKSYTEMALIDSDEKRREDGKHCINEILMEAFDAKLVSGRIIDNQAFLTVKYRGKNFDLYTGDIKNKRYKQQYPFTVR